MDGELIIRLTEALLRLRKAGALLSGEMDLSLLELSALRRLAGNSIESDCNVFAHDLTDEYRASKAAVSQMLSAMEKRGLVQRDFNPQNRRKLIITLTDEGRETVAHAERLCLVGVGRIIDAYGEENARALTGMLERLSDVLDQQDRPSLT